MAALELLGARELTVRIGGVLVCEKLDLDFLSEGCWGIVGGNGVGKTTLLHTLAGLRGPEQGRVTVGNSAIDTLSRRAVARKIGILFQNSTDPFATTVLQTVLIGRHPFMDHLQWETDEDIEIGRRCLALVGLQGLERRAVDTLSGGERRRLEIAVVLAQDPEIMLLDEPLNHLDLRHQISLLDLLRSRNQNKQGCLIMIVHDINMAIRYCSHLLLLFGEGLTRQGPVDALLDEELLGRLLQHRVSIHRVGNHPLVVPD